MRLNEVQFDEVQGELFGKSPTVAKKNRRKLELILKWIGADGAYDRSGRARYAQSLISRADAALYGVSTPRFCVRIYTDDKQSGFLNLRRSHLLRESFGTWMPKTQPLDGRPDIQIDQERQNRGFPLPQIVGDCILPYRKIGRTGFHILEMDYGPDYAEHGSITGTPYVQYCEATGVCAPAACFIVTMLLREHSVVKHGLPEITASATAYSGPHVVIEPMRLGDFTDYLKKVVGLGTCLQRAPRIDGRGKYIDLPATQDFMLQRALQAYVLSGMPVILPVDSHRLHGHCSNEQPMGTVPAVYASNKCNTVRARPPTLNPDLHSMVVVGCTPGSDPKGEFLVHDPSLFPFLKVTAEQVMKSACYKDRQMKELRRGFFQPVTPRQVAMPLLLTPYGGTGKAHMGIYYIATSVLRLNQKIGMPVEDSADMSGSEFRLTTISRMADSLKNGTGLQEELIARAVVELASRPPEKWVWLHVMERSVWVWDAEREPPSGDPEDNEDIRTRYLIAGVAQTDGDVFKSWTNPIVTDTAQRIPSGVAGKNTPTTESPGDAKVPGPLKCDVGILTSFSSQGYRLAIDHWPKTPVPCHADLYTFMHNDVKHISRKLKCVTKKTAVATMATWFADPRLIRDIAKLVATEFHEKGIAIRALATFIPEIMNDNSVVRGEGLDALKFVFRLATELGNVASLEHNVAVVEMVCGGRAQGVWPAIRGTDRLLVAETITDNRRDERMYDCLNALTDTVLASPSCLAVEMEPGPLFAYSNETGLSRLKDIFEAAVRQGMPSDKIGLNLDVTHWTQAGLSPTMRQLDGFRQWVRHAHASDSVCHLADCVPGRVHDEKFFLGWANYIRSCPCTCNAEGTPWCGVSLELECACCLDCVTIGARRTQNYFHTPP